MDKKIRYPRIKPLKIKQQAQIISTGIALPERVITNQDIIDTYDIRATDRAVQYSLGIKERRWAQIDQRIDSLMAEAVLQCLKRANLDIEQMDRVIYSRLLGDYQVPASAVKVLEKLGAKTGIPAFDITPACSGFLQAMDMGIRFIDSGDDYVLLIGGGISSRAIQIWGRPNPKTVFLFGDAMVAMILGVSSTKRFLSSYVLTNHHLYSNALIPFGTSILRKDLDGNDFSVFNMNVLDGKMILKSSIDYSQLITKNLLIQTGYTLDEIDYFITTDQSTRIWEAQLKALDIPPEKSLSLFYKYGNTVSAMSPLILDELIYTGRLKRGDLVMMLAHGAGASSAGMMFRY